VLLFLVLNLGDGSKDAAVRYRIGEWPRTRRR
jgi:hypothetical protein